jgi:excisionase family DNA binding protein
MSKEIKSEMAAPPEGYLTKSELAARCRRTPRTIEVWMARGYLPFIKLGRSVLFNWPDVQRHWTERHRVLRRGRDGIVHSAKSMEPARPHLTTKKAINAHKNHEQ